MISDAVHNGNTSKHLQTCTVHALTSSFPHVKKYIRPSALYPFTIIFSRALKMGQKNDIKGHSKHVYIYCHSHMFCYRLTRHAKICIKDYILLRASKYMTCIANCFPKTLFLRKTIKILSKCLQMLSSSNFLINVVLPKLLNDIGSHA